MSSPALTAAPAPIVQGLPSAAEGLRFALARAEAELPADAIPGALGAIRESEARLLHKLVVNAARPPKVNLITVEEASELARLPIRRIYSLARGADWAVKVGPRKTPRGRGCLRSRHPIDRRKSLVGASMFGESTKQHETHSRPSFSGPWRPAHVVSCVCLPPNRLRSFAPMRLRGAGTSTGSFHLGTRRGGGDGCSPRPGGLENEMKRAARQVRVTEGFEEDPAKGFARPGDLILALMDESGARSASAVKDVRLRFLAEEEGDGAGLSFMLPAAFTPASFRATAGSDEQGIYDDRFGGFAVGSTMAPGIRSRGFEGDPTAGRTQAVPMDSPVVGVLARTDNDHRSSVSGGLTMARRGEAVAITTSRAAMSLVTLKASSLFGFAYATEELIDASPATFAAVVDAGFRLESSGRMLKEKIRGLGGDQYLGVLNALEASGLGPTITVAASAGQGAATIIAENVLAMVARCWGYSNAIWIANHDARPQRFGMNKALGTSGSPIYQFSREESGPTRSRAVPCSTASSPASSATWAT